MPDNSGFNTATTGELLAANDAAARATAAAAAIPPEYQPAAIPATAGEAAARLEAIKSDPKWRDEYLGGSKAHATELRELQAAADKERSTQTEMAIAGQLFDGIQPSGHLAAVGTAEMLRTSGINDTGVIRQVIAGQSVTVEEHAAATEEKARLLRDSDWVAKYTSGDGVAKRQMTLLNIVLSSPIKRVA